ncbi:hypothetical protein KKD62_00270 [Patescibacteria group bacterium]|nr:hypothetical protein [Patescibacteria group bacterium]MBU1931772.1 hypothetical protein [Patescibacteria group bacterium]
MNKTRFYSYLFLISGLSLGLVAFFALSEQVFRLTVAVIIGIFYFSWGMVHHSWEKSLHPKIVLEYLLFALLAVFILISLVLRA